jgi:outer membrane protein assembly factor BamB
MRRIGAVFGALALVTTLSSCWVQPGYDAGHSSWNPHEQTLTSANVHLLTELWDTPLPAAGFVQAPVSVGGAVYATAGGGGVAALDAATGALRWSRRFEVPAGAPSFEAPAWHDGELLVPAAMGSPIPRGSLLRLDPTDGSTISGGDFAGPMALGVAVADDVPAVMHFQQGVAGGPVHVDWTYRVTNIASLFAPSRHFAVAGDRILWTWGPNAQGYSPACAPWPQQPPPDFGCAPDWTTSLAGGATLLSPAIVGTNEVVYVSNQGQLSVLDVATGAVQWSASVDDAVQHAPAVADGVVLVATAGASDGRLVALPAGGCGATTCEPLWEGSIGGTPSAPPVAAGDVAYVATTDGDVVAFALVGCGNPTCAPLARVSAGNRITGGPTVDQGRVIVGTQDGRLLAFGLPA